MAYTLRLEADDLEALLLQSSDGYDVESFDLGDAATRDVVDDAPDADGTLDRTQFVGARSVTMNVSLSPVDDSLSTMLARLRAFTLPRIRPRLFVQFEADSPELMVTLRRSQFSAPVSQVQYAPVTVQWIAPLGILESAEQHTSTAQASGAGSQTGLVAPVVAPLMLNPASVQGAVEITNAGTADVYPLLRLYGPWSGETSIVNDATGKQLVFDGETVVQGDFLEIDTRAKTILLNGDPNASRYHRLLYPDSQWWTLVPGQQRIRFVPGTFTSPAQAQVIWRDAWL